MKHFVNLALVPFFLTLAVTGILRFVEPFTLVTTRIHIVFGFGVLVLVGLHLAERTAYFMHVIRSAGSRDIRQRLVSDKTLAGVLSLWLVLVAAGLWNLPPVNQLIELSYESRHRAVIFRSDPQTVYKPVEDGLRLKRVTDSDASLLIQLDWGPEFPDSFVRPGAPFADFRPQVAIWTESQNGSLIETLFLSEKAAFNESFQWSGHEQERVDILPLWRHRYTLKTGVDPDGDQMAFSGATPDHSFSVYSYLKTDSNPFYLYVEINSPGDPNDFYHADQESDHPGYMRPGLGQPSILYGAYVRPTDKKQYLLLELVGHGGSTSTRDGNIHYDSEQLTSAKQLVEKILVRVQRTEPEEAEADRSRPVS